MSRVASCAAQDDVEQAMSQDTGSSADRAFAVAWARVHGNSRAAAPSRLATSWQTQHDSQADSPHTHTHPLATSPPRQPIVLQHLPPEQPATAQPSELPVVEGAVQQLHQQDEAAAPDGDQVYNANEQLEAHPASASPLSAAPALEPGKAVVSSPPKAAQQQVTTALRSPAAAGKGNTRAVAADALSSPAGKAAKAVGRSPIRGAHLAGIAAAAASAQQAKVQTDSCPPDLEARATQQAMQVGQSQRCVLYVSCQHQLLHAIFRHHKHSITIPYHI